MKEIIDKLTFLKFRQKCCQHKRTISPKENVMGGSQKRSSPFFSNKTYFFVLNPTQELKGAFWILRAKIFLFYVMILMFPAGCWAGWFSNQNTTEDFFVTWSGLDTCDYFVQSVISRTGNSP